MHYLINVERMTFAVKGTVADAIRLLKHSNAFRETKAYTKIYPDGNLSAMSRKSRIHPSLACQLLEIRPLKKKVGRDRELLLDLLFGRFISPS